MNRILLFLLLIASTSLFAQEEFLSRHINHTSKNNIVPAISGNGKTMIYLTDYSNTGDMVMELSQYKGGKWNTPKEITAINPMRLVNNGGYFMDNTGEAIWFSSRKPDGLGGYDIWDSKKSGSNWSRSKNHGKPLNSSMDEGDPSISPDNQKLYFMRCSRIAPETAKGCKIFVSEKNKGRGAPWKEPEELPSHLNVGNTLSPRILSDNKTLVFSSDRPGGKGGLDLWMSTLNAGEWSTPINVEFANTQDDERYMSMSLRTDYAFLTRKNETGYYGIVKAKVPEEFRPQDVIMMMGKVVDDQGTPKSLDIRINNYATGKLVSRVISEKETGDFVAVLTEGNTFEITYEDRSGKLAFQTQIINIEELRNSRREYPKIELTTVAKGAQFDIGGIVFDTLSSTITAASNFEVMRLARLIKQHKDLHFNIQIYQEDYKEDSLQLPWLTEVKYDSIRVMLPPIDIDSMDNSQKDSLLIEMNDSLGATTLTDTLIANDYQARMSGVDSIETWKKIPIYHNDRTPHYKETVLEHLKTKGVTEDLITIQALGLIPADKKQEAIFINGVAIIVSIE